MTLYPWIIKLDNNTLRAAPNQWSHLWGFSLCKGCESVSHSSCCLNFCLDAPKIETTLRTVASLRTGETHPHTGHNIKGTKDVRRLWRFLLTTPVTPDSKNRKWWSQSACFHFLQNSYSIMWRKIGTYCWVGVHILMHAPKGWSIEHMAKHGVKQWETETSGWTSWSIVWVYGLFFEGNFENSKPPFRDHKLDTIRCYSLKRLGIPTKRALDKLRLEIEQELQDVCFAQDILRGSQF